jgi:hypothetical protein
MNQEATHGGSGSSEKKDTFRLFCQEMAEKMTSCGPMMEEMMTRCGPIMENMMGRCMEKMKSHTPAAEGGESTDE